MRGLHVRLERPEEIIASLLCAVGHQKGIPGIRLGEIAVHHRSCVIRREGAHQQHAIPLPLEVVGQGNPQIAGRLDGHHHPIRPAIFDASLQMLPEGMVISRSRHGE